MGSTLWLAPSTGIKSVRIAWSMWNHRHGCDWKQTKCLNDNLETSWPVVSLSILHSHLLTPNSFTYRQWVPYPPGLECEFCQWQSQYFLTEHSLEFSSHARCSDEPVTEASSVKTRESPLDNSRCGTDHHHHHHNNQSNLPRPHLLLVQQQHHHCHHLWFPSHAAQCRRPLTYCSEQRSLVQRQSVGHMFTYHLVCCLIEQILWWGSRGGTVFPTTDLIHQLIPGTFAIIISSALAEWAKVPFCNLCPYHSRHLLHWPTFLVSLGPSRCPWEGQLYKSAITEGVVLAFRLLRTAKRKPTDIPSMGKLCSAFASNVQA